MARINQVFPRADVNNIFLKRIYQNSSTSIGYCPQFFALSRQPSTFEHILVYVVLLECAAHSTHDLKGHYSTVELQKHGGDGETRTLISLQITGVQAQTDTDFWLRLHNGTPNENRTHIIR